MVTSMTIENVIKRSCINLHMKGRNKKEIIEEMADMFDRAGVLASRDLFIRAVYEREGADRDREPGGHSPRQIGCGAENSNGCWQSGPGSGVGDPGRRGYKGICYVCRQ